MKIYKIFVSALLFASSFLAACSPAKKGEAAVVEDNEPRFVTVENGRLMRDGKPYTFIGTNLWYAPILGSTGEGGDRERLAKELDALNALGVKNLRVLVGADGGSKNANSVVPYLQPEPGVLNDTLLAGLDYALCEMAKRDMTAVLYLTNAWDWSGGIGFYLRECGFGDSPNASGEGYNDYVRYSSDFVRSDSAKAMYYNFVRSIVSRTNSITGKPYSSDPAIMSWQICNEPRAFGKENKELLYQWLTETAALIKEIDGNHLVSTGSEGIIGCEVDAALCERIHSDKNIDYLTIHIWPINWGWASRTAPDGDIENACKKSGEYIDAHIEMAKRTARPIVIEEFGFSRRDNISDLAQDTESRDRFYDYIFSRVVADANGGGVVAGCNFWGWGGSGRPRDLVWRGGDDFLCDPPHEPQGWYSVFDCDTTTIELIKKHSSALNK